MERFDTVLLKGWNTMSVVPYIFLLSPHCNFANLGSGERHEVLVQLFCTPRCILVKSFLGVLEEGLFWVIIYNMHWYLFVSGIFTPINNFKSSDQMPDREPDPNTYRLRIRIIKISICGYRSYIDKDWGYPDQSPTMGSGMKHRKIRNNWFFLFYIMICL